MVKAYLRYEHRQSFGVICSNSNAVFDHSGKCLISASLENVAVWDIKQGKLTTLLTTPAPENGGACPEVTKLALSPKSDQIAAGYSDGSIRIWDLTTKECKVVFHGHKNALTALKFSHDGSILASGSQDTDVCVWDVIGESGVCKLRGHKGQVTDLGFIRENRFLVSCSKDSFIRVWDLSTQHCCQTVVGDNNNSEVWSLDVEAGEKLLVVGSVGKDVRVYRINDEHSGDGSSKIGEILTLFGVVVRKESDRVQCVRFSGKSRFLAVQGSGKVVEIFEVKDWEEAEKKLKKRLKRKAKKLKQKSEPDSTNEEMDIDLGGNSEQQQEQECVMPQDMFIPWRSVRSKHRIRSLDFRPGKLKPSLHLEMGLVLTNNAFEMASFTETVSENDGGVAMHSKLDMPGNRSAIRSLCLAPDDSLLVSTSEKEVKVWKPDTGECIHTMQSGYGLTSMLAPGNSNVLVGTKAGNIEIFDIRSAELVATVDAHEGPVWSIVPLPQNKGVVTGGGDKTIKFWSFAVNAKPDGVQKHLTVKQTKSIDTGEDVLCVRISPDQKLIAIALLDSTIKVYYLDSMKLFLTLYGHKLPVLTMDISSDSQLLVSGSADKNIKIWGLDFGDCHKSIFAHQDSVTQVSFVHTTHYVFSVGKDKMLKYWDVDKFQLLLELPGHHKEVWCMAVSKLGDYLVTGSNDRSIRRWEKTDEPFFLDEEKEKRLESMFEAELDVGEDDRRGGQEDASVGPAGRKSLASINAADSITDALEMASHESKRKADCKQSNSEFQPNPLLLGLNPSTYVLKAVQNVKPGDLEMALMSISFSDALRLMGYLCEWLEQGGGQIETICRVAVLLVRLHLGQLSTSVSARGTLVRLQNVLRDVMKGVKDTMGFNLAGLRHLQGVLKRKKGVQPEDEIVPVKQKIRMAS